jgi:hypothetical protein
MASRRFVLLLVLAAVVGVVAALVAWGFLELAHQVQVGAFDTLPDALGYDDPPAWWPLPVAAVAGLIVAFAITRMPGGGGHVPVHGLKTDPTPPSTSPEWRSPGWARSRSASCSARRRR